MVEKGKRKDEKNKKEVDTAALLMNKFADRSLVYGLLELNLAFMGLHHVPRDLKLFESLEVLNLSRNRMRNLDSNVLVRDTPNLRCLDLSDNLLTVFAEIEQLGSLCWLEELNLLGNPFPISNNRTAMVQNMFFQHPFTPKHYGKLPKVKTNKQKESNRSPKKTLSLVEKKAIIKKYGYVPDQRNKPRMKPRKTNSFMKHTSSYERTVKNPMMVQYEGTPSTLMTYHYNFEQLRKSLLKNKKSLRVIKSDFEDYYEYSPPNSDEDEMIPNPQKRIEMRMKKFASWFRPCQMKPFKESLKHVASLSGDMANRLKDCEVPRDWSTPFPMLRILNQRAISIEQYLTAENEAIFDLCKVSPQIKTVDPHTIDSDAWDLGVYDPIVENDLDEDKGLDQRMIGMQKSAKLSEELNYLRVNQKNRDISHITTFHDAHNEVDHNKDMQKNLEKSLKAEYVGMNDYKTVDGKEKWDNALQSFDLSVDINFNDILRWEHKQICKKTREILGKSRKRNVKTHGTSLKHQILNLDYDQVETKFRKIQLDLNLSEAKRRIKPLNDQHNPHLVTEFCRLERSRMKNEARKKGILDFSQQVISEKVKRDHPDDDIIKFFGDTQNNDYLNIPTDKTELQIARQRLKERGIKVNEKNIRKEIHESQTSVEIDGETFQYSPLMV